MYDPYFFAQQASNTISELQEVTVTGVQRTSLQYSSMVADFEVQSLYSLTLFASPSNTCIEDGDTMIL